MKKQKAGAAIALGGVVEQAQQHFMDNPKPCKLGKLYCFWYSAQGNPRIVIGPDFKFSLVELGLVNGIMSLVIKNAISSESVKVYQAGFVILLLHNLSFLATICMNQGLPPRNPASHSKSYLNSVNTI